MRKILLLLPSIIFVGCGKKKPANLPGHSVLKHHNHKSKQTKSRRHKKQTIEQVQIKQFQIFVEGVECPFCAQSVVDLFNEMPSVFFAEFDDAQGYENGFVRVGWTYATRLDRELIQARLEQLGFDLKDIKEIL